MKIYRGKYSVLFASETTDFIKLEAEAVSFIKEELKISRHPAVEVESIDRLIELTDEEQHLLLWGPADEISAFQFFNDPKTDPEYAEYMRLHSKFTEKFKKFGGEK